MDEEAPDLIVGVDFGMTFTGVSYANLSIGNDTVKWIQKWPGKAYAHENKVPTILAYPKGSPIPSSWGFHSEMPAEQNSLNREHKDWFKTSLDPKYLERRQKDDPTSAPSSMEEVGKLYEDYLRALYKHIEFKLSPELSRTTWHKSRIEFVFSVPTTWEPSTVELFRSIAALAGFGQAPHHIINIGLTEAEAAAIHTSVEAPRIFKERDVVLICDAGGGTTDLSVLRVTGTTAQSISLEQLDVVFGRTFGSAAIDADFEMLVKARLQKADHVAPLNISPEVAAWEMMKSKDFQNTKCEHGGPDDTPIFSVPIFGINPNYVNRDLGIENGGMNFAREDLNNLFDTQVHQLTALIDTQLQSMLRKFADESVTHLILSGGLGHSPYVRERLTSYFHRGGENPNARDMLVRAAPDPQLAVCKGLVSDRVNKLRSGASIIKWRCCRASYGIQCRERYNKKNPQHMGQPIVKDPIDGRLYIEKSIVWFIRKGEGLSVDDAVSREFTRQLKIEDPRKPFLTFIVTSNLDPHLLPHNVNSDTRILDPIKSYLSSVDDSEFKERKKHFWNKGKHHFEMKYQIKVFIGAADIRFEIHSKDQKLSHDQPIKADIVAASASERLLSMGMERVDGVLR